MKYTVIKNKKQYVEYCDKLMELNFKPSSKANNDDIELLEVLIDKWDKDNYKTPKMDPIQLLNFLMSNHNLNRNDLINLLGIGKSAVSQILDYKKGLSKEVIRKLSEHFKVSQEAFNRPYPIKAEENKHHKNERMMNTVKVLEPA
jgi:HTH-type transcriptional regulator/antitoxin HigA